MPAPTTRDRPVSADDTSAVTPRVSIVMAVYNGANYLEAAIRSVVLQDYTDWELIIVDDGSTDSSRDIAQCFRDSRIRLIQNERNLGQTPSLNRGLHHARGEYVGRIDADDRYLAGKLAAQVAYLDGHPDVAVLGTWARRIDENDKPIGLFRPPADPQDLRFHLIHGPPLCHVSVVARRSALLAVDGYDERYRYSADFALWSTLYARGFQLCNLPRVLMEYREFGESFGAAAVLGRAGKESAEILRGNARSISGVELSPEEALTLHLRNTPTAHLDAQRRRWAYALLAEFAKRVYGRTPLSVRLNLCARLTWSLASAERQPAPSGPWPANRLAPDLRIAAALGSALNAVGAARVRRIKTSTWNLLTRLR